jgi:protein-disulfide isomerase
MAVARKQPIRRITKKTTVEPVEAMALPTSEPKRSIIEKLVPFMMFGVVLLSFVVGILWEKVQSLESGKTNQVAQQQQAAQQPGQEVVTVTEDQIKKLFNEKVMTFGDKNSKVTFVAVEDPSCPFCHIASGKNSELIDQLVESNPQYAQFKLVADGGTYVPPMSEIQKLVDAKKASLVYIYSNGHGNGEMGHKALICANEKGKFWQAHDLLYSNKGYDLLNNTVKNDKTKSKELSDFLASAVSAADMKSCLDSGKYDDRPASEMAVAQSLGVSGTPGFFINTTKYAGAYSYAQMEASVNQILSN